MDSVLFTENDSDSENVSEAGLVSTKELDFEALKKLIINTSAEKLKKNSKVAGISLDELKEVAEHLGMTKSTNKSVLVDALKNRLNNTSVVERIFETNRGAVLPQQSKFIRDLNTIPRICNILACYPDGLLSSRNAASWTDLQNGTQNAGNPVWEDAAENFNDKNFVTGGLVRDHEEFTKRKIDPQAMNSSGLIDAVRLSTYFFECKKLTVFYRI